MKITIEHNILKSLLLIAAKSDIRYYLNAVCIDARANGDVVLVATDGHRLLAWPVAVDDIEYADGEPIFVGEVIIPRDALEAVKPMKAGRHSFPITITTTTEPDTQDSERPGVTIKGKTTIVIVGQTTLTTPAVDGKYPDWRRIMPKAVSGEPAQYNADYIGDFGKVCLLLGSKYPSPRINHNGTGGAVITNLYTSRAIGMLMPMRDDSVAAFTSLPDWARAE